MSAAMTISREYMALIKGGEWSRKHSERIETPPTAEDMAEYDRAVALVRELEGNRFVEWGEDGIAAIKPEPAVEYVYSETEDEWLERIAKLDPNDMSICDPDPLRSFLDGSAKG